MDTAQHYFKIVIIGAGNVATHFANRLKKKGHDILQIVSRSSEHAQTLSIKIGVPFVTDIKKINTHADIYLLCVPDDEIEKLNTILNLPKKLILHTSGSVSMATLKNISANIGVLYPLQSFSKKTKISFSSVPLLIEASNAETLQQLKILAASLSKNINEVNSTNRLKIHVAATMVNNFTNHLYYLSNDFLTKEKSDYFHLLLPLIKQTAKKIKTNKPSDVQTGPAKRGDEKTIKKHLQVLEKYSEQKKVYELFTSLIKKQYHV
ncbi:MAG TPA: DUF2520 domain-containing protein [Bacteroidia bacterium]|nr:DUF2520 domain-containing protein [Bacteroidia bacterium]